MCRADIERLWVSLGESRDSFRPDEWFSINSWGNLYIRIELFEPLPEGVVVVR